MTAVVNESNWDYTNAQTEDMILAQDATIQKNPVLWTVYEPYVKHLSES